MKNIFVTQRVDIIESYNERRDALDQKWSEFLFSNGFIPFLISNNLSIVKEFLNTVKVDGFLFTGGNDLVSLGGNAPERDGIEKYLIQYSIQNKIPILGVCRGMQIILDYFNYKLIRVEGHVRTNHKLKFNDELITTNSFHNYSIKNIEDNFLILAQSEDGCIEAIKHTTYPIYGIMWHPERDNFFQDYNNIFLKKVFGNDI